MARKIALIGNGETIDQAPFDDPAWDIWALAWMVPQLPRATLAFEMHQREHVLLDDVHYPKEGGLTAVLNTLHIPIMMLQRYGDIPSSVAFPRGEALLNLGWEEEHVASSV